MMKGTDLMNSLFPVRPIRIHARENKAIETIVAFEESMKRTNPDEPACLYEKYTEAAQRTARIRFNGKANIDINKKSIYAKIAYFY